MHTLNLSLKHVELPSTNVFSPSNLLHHNPINLSIYELNTIVL